MLFEIENYTKTFRSLYFVFHFTICVFQTFVWFTVKVLQTRCLCTWNISVNKHIKWRQMFSILYLRRFWLCMQNVMWDSRCHKSLAFWWPLFLFHRLSCYTVRTDRSTFFFYLEGFSFNSSLLQKVVQRVKLKNLHTRQTVM